MTRRSLMSLAASVPALAAHEDARKINLPAGLVENFSASLRSSNTTTGKMLLELSWKRPQHAYHGALMQAFIQQRSGGFAPAEAVVFSDPAVEPGSHGLAVIDAVPLLKEAAGRKLRIVALPLDSTGASLGHTADFAPRMDLREPRKKPAGTKAG